MCFNAKSADGRVRNSDSAGLIVRAAVADLLEVEKATSAPKRS